MKLSLLLKCAVLLLPVTLVTVVKSYAQNSGITSKFYFPGGLGISYPFGNPHLDLKRGIMLTTALEFRPVEGNALFIRFNYDAITNHYQQVYQNSPTNVTTGKLSSTIFSLGLGYRQKVGIFKVFGLLQPGIGINNYDRVHIDQGAISVNQISRSHLSFKVSGGLEYYLAQHFAVTIEPSFFYLSPRGNYRLLNAQSFNLSMGFTTTLF
ncbi:Outer membrane protein beta-barrel domain-containing protein [Mucilaginibacter pineti]|uniref:Outer membrane protein beta-barrel domain-containing protein n=1 Tax=Mucilaginibacter pineti TaxID=1391627 RepID=A0A1G7M1C2_9SPHI|nr:outer membrane beta-barrel protein [Mucilaginibacter pineti]SDF55547.1 Outer membrane protein beta-barrel domain-containing protein [Mucilaginibacter pineti]